MLVTTHYMSEAEHCDHLALMYAGRVVADATPLAMKQTVAGEAGHLLEVVCADAPHALTVLHQAGLPEVSLFGRTLHVLSKQPAVDTPRITQALAAAGLAGVKVTPRSLTMEDVFVYRVTSLEAQERSAAASPVEAAA